MSRRLIRSRFSRTLAETLEPRQLLSMSAKLPVLPVAEAPAAITVIDDTPATDRGSIAVAARVPFTRKLTTLPDFAIRYAIPSEVTGPAKMYTAIISWGDGTSSAAEFRRSDSGAVEVWGTHTYAATGEFHITFTVSVINFVPPGFDPNEYAWTLEMPPTYDYALTAQVSDVVAQSPLAGGPADLTVLPVKTRLIVGETTGGVLTIYSGDQFRILGESGPGTPVYAVINWGDGTYEAGTIARFGNEVLISGYHAYLRPGNFHVIVTLVPYSNDPLALVAPPTDISNTLMTVTLNSSTGNTVKARGTRDLNATLASIPNFGAFPATGSTPQSTLSRPASGNNPAAALRAMVAWGDGTVSQAQLRSNRSGGFDIVGFHRYASEGTYRTQVFLEVAYNGGAFAHTLQMISGIALVGNVPGNVPFLPNITYPLTRFSQQTGVVGQLATGVVAIGGETTGYEVRGAGFTYELEFATPELKAKADTLNNKSIRVGGTLTIRAGVEIGQRRILLVSVLEEV